MATTNPNTARITLAVPPEVKTFYKMEALKEQSSLKDYVLDAMQTKVKSKASNQGTLKQAIKEMENGEYTEYKSLEEFFADMETW